MPGDISLPGAGAGVGANSQQGQNIAAQQAKAAPGYQAQQAYERMNPTDQASIKNFYESYNNAYADPSLVQSISSNAGLNPQHAALALKYLALYNSATDHIKASANANDHGATLWGALTGAYHSVVHAGLDVIKWAADQSNPNKGILDAAGRGFNQGGISGAVSAVGQQAEQNYGGLARGAASGVEGLAQTGWDVAKRAGKTMYELAGSNGLAGYGDAFETLWHLALAPVNLVNPWSQSNGYQLMAHTMAYYESVANKYGWDYAIGHAMPSIAAMFATDGVMGTSNVVAAGADDASLIKAAEQAVQDGKVLTRAEKSVLKQARDRIAQRAEKSANFQKLRDSMDTRRAFVAKVAEHIPNPVSGIYRIARVAGKPMNDIRLNMAYQVTQAQAQKANPQLAKLWEDTRGGMVMSHDGKPVDLGQQTAEYFGLHPNDMLFSPLSGVTDLYTKYLGADPLGAVGKVAGIRRSYEGLTGSLGGWFRGIGIKSASDVYELMNRSYVRRAFQFMADNSEGKIRDMFRGTYSDAVIKKLAKASTVEEVAKVHADLANGAGLIRYSLPTLTVYDDLKATFISKLYGKLDVQTALASDKAFEESVATQIENATKRRGATGYDVRPKDGLYIQERDVALRWRTVFRRWCATQLVKRPMYYSELTKGFETAKIIPGDKNSIPAIMDMARAAMMPEDTVMAMGDFLSQSRTAEDFVNAYRQSLYHIVMRRAVTGLDHTALDSISKNIENHIWDEVNRVVGVDGGGLNGLYVNGQGNIDLSKVITSDMRDTAAAIDTTQLGTLRLPNARDLNAIGRTVKNELTRLMPHTMNVNDFSTWSEDIFRVADQFKIGVKEARSQSSILAKYRMQSKNLENLPFESKGLASYKKAHGELNAAYGAAIKSRKAGAQEFTDFYDSTRAERKKLSDALSFDKANREDLAAGGKGEPGYKPLTKAQIEDMRGRLYAHEDHLISMNTLLARENVIGPNWIKDWAEKEAARLNPGDVNPRITKRFIDRMDAIRGNGDVSNYRNNFQHVVDNINKGLSRVFVPLALLSGRWAMHVSASEGMLNSLRFGAFNFFDAKFAEAVARHELNGLPLYKAGFLPELDRLVNLTGKDGKNVYTFESAKEEYIARQMGNGDAAKGRELIKQVKSAKRSKEEIKLEKFWESFRNTDINVPGSGASISISGTLPTTGFMVGWDSSRGVIIKAKDFSTASKRTAAIEGFIQDNLDYLKEQDFTVGLWHNANPDDGEVGVHLDISKNIKDRKEAIREGKNRDQIAIFDLNTFTTIPTGGKGSVGKIWSAADRLKIDKQAQRLKELTDSVNYVNSERSLIRDVLAGTLLGLEKSMLKGMSEQERMNMIDNFTGAIMRHNGHLPMGVHDQNTVYDPNVMFGHMPDKIADVSGEVIDSRKVYRTQDFTSLNNGQLGYAHGLNEALTKLNRGEISPPILKELQALLEDKALFKTVNGRLVIKNVKNLEEALLPAALDAIHALPRDTYERFVRKDAVNMDWRTSATGARKDVGNFEFTKQHAEEDWARANVKNILGTITGTDRYGDVLHTNLLDQAVSGEIAGGMDMAHMVAEMGQAAPKDIVSRGFKSAGLLDSGMKSNFLIRVSNVGHDKILGPIVNNLVRNPTWLLEYHNQYEVLRPLVEKGLMDEAHAEILADSRATQNMAKFVHNPKDKTVWEDNMRAAAPFYFAKNQAWRRAFRLFRTDPGAFEKYMKASLAVTDYIYNSTQNGTSPSVSIPGSEFMGFSSASWLDGGIPGFSSLAFGLSGGPGSVTSVVPTGDMFTPWGLFGEFVRPPWGPSVTVPLKLVRYAFMGNNPTYTKFMEAALGHISSNTSWISDLVPSGSVHDAAQIFLAGINSTNSSALSTENQVLNNAMDNMRAEYRKQIANEYDWSGMTKAQKELTISGLADQKVSEFFNDPLNKQRFLDQAKASTMLMLTVKSVLNFFSPMALSLNARFSRVPEFNNIMNQTDPSTGKPYTFIAAADKFAKEYPNNIYDLTAHTQSQYTSYPETTSALKLLEGDPGLVEKYPYAAAFLMQRSGQYSPQAYQLELSMGLRKRQAPADYLSGLLVATGDDYYYNYLKPSLMADPNNVQTKTIQNADGTTTTVKDLTYTASKELKYAAKMYGDNSNPIWYEQFSGAAKKNAASQTITEMQQLLNDKQHDPFAPGERAKFAQLVDEYQKTNTVLSEYRTAGNSQAYNGLYNAWYDYCTQIANNPYYAGQSFFITSALQKMPSQ